MKRCMFFTLLILAAACSSHLPLTGMPDLGIPIEEMNLRIEVFAPKSWNNFKINAPIGLVIRATAQDQVVFATDYGVRIFIYGKGEWIEVKNRMQYLYQAEDILNPSADPVAEGSVIVSPALPDSSKMVQLRIFVIGNIYRDGERTEEKVGAYTDVTLKP